MMKRRISLACRAGIGILLSAGLLSWPASGLSAQERPGQKAVRVPRHDAAAVVKLVPVRVLDRSGKPVVDLIKDDFVLYDNKELKTITEFEVHRLAEAEPGREIQKAAGKEAAIARTGRKFFILLDVQGSDETGNANAQKAALHFVEAKLQPGDEAAVLYFAPMTGLNLAQYLTSDLDKIKKAIGRAKEHPPSAGFSSGAGGGDSVEERPSEHGENVPRRARVMTGRPTVAAPGESASESPGAESSAVGVPGLGIMGRSHADYQASLSDLAKVLPSVPGSKNLILFSCRGVSPALGREFAASNTPIFTVNSKNWIEKGIYSVSIKAKHIWEDHPLKDLALASGGQYYADIQAVETIADSIQVLTGHYYVLGYYIDEKWDGRYHEIKVEVKKSECRVLVQEGYYNPKPYAQLTDLEKKVHLYDLAFADRPALQDPLGLLLECSPSPSLTKANTLILSRLPVEERTGIPPGREELFIFMFDKGHRNIFSRRWEMDFQAHAGQTFYPYFTCWLPPGDYECRLVTRDLETGESARGSAFFQVPSAGTPDIQVDPPLLLAPGKEAQFMKLTEAGKEKRPAPSIIQLYPILPKGCAPLVGNLEPDAGKLWAIVPVQFAANGTPELELEAELSGRQGGQKILLESEILDVREAAENSHFILMEIHLPELDPGEYGLEIAVFDAAAQATQTVKTRLAKK